MRRGFAVLGLLALGSASCGAGSGPLPSTSLPQPSSLPGLALGPEDEIDALEAVSTSDGTLHVVWRERLVSPSGIGRFRLRHAESRDGGESWSGPREFPGSGIGGFRVLAAGPDLHLVQGPGLAHSLRGADGDWRTLPPMLAESNPGAVSWDALIAGNLLCTAALAGTSQGGLELVLVEQRGSAPPGPPQRLATFPPSSFDPPRPRLVVSGRRLYLLVGVNAEIREKAHERGRLSERISSRAEVHVFHRDVEGGPWSRKEIPPPAAGEPLSWLDDVALVLSEGEALVLMAAHGLWVSRWEQSWSAPVRVTGGEAGWFAGGTGSRSLTADGGRVAWVDERFRRTDRRAWNPLGGWPWSDSPEWANNDLFLVSRQELREALAAGPLDPHRQTWPGSMTRQARLVAGSDAVYLVWAGRRQVGKDAASLGAPPEIFVRLFPPADG